MEALGSTRAAPQFNGKVHSRDGGTTPVPAEQLEDLERALLGPAAALPPPADAIPIATLGAKVGAVTKRIFDVVLALVLIVVAAPLMLAVAIAVKLESSGPILFRQRRLGRSMRPFSMLKFRTMDADANPTLHEQFIEELARDMAPGRDGLKKLVDDPRVTGVGRVIRRLSIDELPQLFNVLSGRMSIVGPRPALDYEIRHYAPAHYERFHVRPGLTGLWQVSGRNELGFLDMLELDIEYVSEATLLTDLRILALTPRAAVGRTA